MTENKQPTEFRDVVELLTIPEAVARIGGSVSEATLRRYRQQGKGPAHVEHFGRILYPVADLDAWIATQPKVAR